MAEQATWVPLPKKRAKVARLPEALAGANRMIDWYLSNKPKVRRLAVTSAQHKAFHAAVGQYGIMEREGRIHYRGFCLYVA